MALTCANTSITLCGFNIYHHGNVISQHTCGNNISHIGNNISKSINMYQLQTVVITSTTLAITTAIIHTGPKWFNIYHKFYKSDHNICQ